MKSPKQKGPKPDVDHEESLDTAEEALDRTASKDDIEDVNQVPGGDEGVGPDRATETAEELNDRYLRLAAEFENYKKRTAREWQTRAESANTELLFELLDIVDNFERALDAEHEESAYAHGVRLIYDQLQNLLKRREVVPMKAMGTPFNPEIHDALLHVHSDDMADGLVCQVIKQGYEYRGRILRPAQVAVSRGPNQVHETQSDTDAVTTDAAEAEDSK